MLDEDQDKAVRHALHETTVKYTQTVLEPPLKQATDAAARIDALTGHDKAHSGAHVMSALSRQIDFLAPALANAGEVPKSTGQALLAAWKFAEGKATYGSSDKGDQIRALGRLMQEQLDAINQALGPGQVKSNIIIPAVTPFAS